MSGAGGNTGDGGRIAEPFEQVTDAYGVKSALPDAPALLPAPAAVRAAGKPANAQ